MIRFLRATDLVDYAGTEEQLNFCLLAEDCAKVEGVPVLEGLTPPELALSTYERSRKTGQDLKIFERAYAMFLNGYSALVFVHGIVDMSKSGVDFNIVVNSGQLCMACVNALTECFIALTNDVEVLI